MPTMEDVHVDPTARAGKVTSLVSDPTADTSSSNHPKAAKSLGLGQPKPAPPSSPVCMIV